MILIRLNKMHWISGLQDGSLNRLKGSYGRSCALFEEGCGMHHIMIILITNNMDFPPSH